MDFPSLIRTLLDLATIIAGFSLIILLHELGHFIAARWAGIRTLAFAMGFGPAVFSYRRGLGFRRGSSEEEYLELLKADPAAQRGVTSAGVASTEYRLNWLPLGGYVKMLGQEDLDPNAISAEPDSYQKAPPWKRMIVISAGVIMNIITAAVLFIIVFMIGLRTDAAVIGQALPGAPAEQAVATNAEELGVDEPGLAPGDRITRINGRRPRSFDDANIAILMNAPNEPVRIEVARQGYEEALRFSIMPERDPVIGTLSIGVTTASSTTVQSPLPPLAEQFASSMQTIGLGEVQPGATLLRVNDREVASASELARLIHRGDGSPLTLHFAQPDGEAVNADVIPLPRYETAYVELDAGSLVPIEHLLGLTPAMRVSQEAGSVTGPAKDAGLEPGDIFARIGRVEYPSLSAGISEIRAHAGRSINLVVLRDEGEGRPRRIDLTASVSRQGRVGFAPDTTADISTLLALPPRRVLPAPGADQIEPAARRIIEQAGLRVLAVNGVETMDFAQLRAALLRAVEGAGGQGATLMLDLAYPIGDAQTVSVEWKLSPEEIAAINGLGWRAPFAIAGVFAPEQTVLVADGPLSALGLGVAETHRVMLSTYLTFVRLFQGTVKIEHLKGPVGIAHVGTIIAKRGWVWVIFFMAIISVNLAVVNFLPLPIVDGGHFLMIVYEQILRKPVPIGVQNLITLAGLGLIATIFLLVTYYDLRALLG